jgi:predicted transcriptional regulator
MKTARIPSLRVDPELRQAAESVLQKGETLSSFVVQSLRISIEHRRMRREFIARGLASRDEARRTGEYFEAEEVLREME